MPRAPSQMEPTGSQPHLRRHARTRAWGSHRAVWIGRKVFWVQGWREWCAGVARQVPRARVTESASLVPGMCCPTYLLSHLRLTIETIVPFTYSCPYAPTHPTPPPSSPSHTHLAPCQPQSSPSLPALVCLSEHDEIVPSAAVARFAASFIRLSLARPPLCSLSDLLL